MVFDIAPYIHKEENENLEYKEIFVKNKVAIAIAALSTNNGGTILIGVNDKGVPLGIKNCKEDTIQKEIFNIKNNMNDSFPNVKIDFVNHSPTEKIIVLQVSDGPKKPYGWGGIFYKREGSANRKLMPDEITQLNLAAKNITFDGLRAHVYGREATLGDISEDKMIAYIDAYNQSRRNKKMQYTTKENFLCNTGLLLNNGIKNAALLLFGLKPQDAFTNSRINFLFYDSDVEDSTKLKQKTLIRGDVISQINEAVELIKVYTENKVVMRGLRRLEVSQYPIEAIREAMINAVAHRDYSVFDSYINVRLFNNRLEITNPGGLMEGLTVESIKEGGLSKRRNPHISLILDNIGLMEQSGQGIKNIIQMLVNAGLREPTISEKNNFFKMEFYGQDISPDSDANLVGTSTDLSESLTRKQKLGLEKMQMLNITSLGIDDYMQISGISTRVTAKSHLEIFRELGILTVKKRGKAWVYTVNV